MSLSVGQINDAFSAVGKTPTGADLAKYSGRTDLEGDTGKNQLISELGGGGAGNAPSGFTSNFSGVGNPVQTAQQLVQFTQQANQPAIQQLQSSIDPLEQRYNDLLTSIKGQGTVAQNYAQQSASMNLANRGLLPQSQEGQQAIGNALLPVTQATSGALAQTGLGEQQDINQINQAIATLQAGNPTAAAQLASSIYGQQLQNLTAKQVGSIANQFKEFGLGGGVVNTQTGQLVGGGGGGNGFSLSSVGNTGNTTTNTTPLFSTTPIGPPGPSSANASTQSATNNAIDFLNSINSKNFGGYTPIQSNLNFNPSYNTTKNPNSLNLGS